MALKKFTTSFLTSGLTTVGLTLIDLEGAVVTSRAQMAAEGEIKPYLYEVAINVPDDFTVGKRRWDDGGDVWFDEDLFLPASVDLSPVLTAIGALNVGSGSGANEVTVTVTDGTSPLQNARVRLSEGANTFVRTTNADGEASFSLDDATYSLAVTKSGYSFTPSQAVVNGPESVTAVMTSFAWPAAESLDKVQVLVDLAEMGVGQTPDIEGLVVKMELKPDSGTVVNNEFLFDVSLFATTDADGRAFFELAPTADNRIWYASVMAGTKNLQLGSFSIAEDSGPLNLAEELSA